MKQMNMCCYELEEFEKRSRLLAIEVGCER